MASFQVEQYEIHVTTYQVEAENMADAIEQVYNGNGEELNKEYFGYDENRGMSVGELSRDEAKELGLSSNKIVPGIKTVREV